MTEDSNYTKVNTHVKGKYYLILLISNDVGNIKEKAKAGSYVNVETFAKTLEEKL